LILFLFFADLCVSKDPAFEIILLFECRIRISLRSVEQMILLEAA